MESEFVVKTSKTRLAFTIILLLIIAKIFSEMTGGFLSGLIISLLLMLAGGRPIAGAKCKRWIWQICVKKEPSGDEMLKVV